MRGYGVFKRIFTVAAAVMSALALVACSERETIAISSSVWKLGDSLGEGKFDFEYAEKMSDPDNTAKPTPYYISVRDDRLLITAADPLGGDVMSVDCGNGMFIGTADGISYLPIDGELLPLTNEACLCLYRRDGGCMALTSAGGMTKLLLIASPTDGGAPYITVAASRYGYAAAAAPTADGEGMLAVATAESTALLRMTTEGKITVLSEDSVIGAVESLSLLEWRERIYCASPIGIYEFNPSTELVTWFPLEVD